MEILNKYFILSLPEPALSAILSHCVEGSNTVRKNKAGTKSVVKLPVNSEIPNILKSKTKYNHSEILTELSKPEWINNEL